ncbi:hypothetical protein B296_00044129, partial [Ensete ventricosum]
GSPCKATNREGIRAWKWKREKGGRGTGRGDEPEKRGGDTDRRESTATPSPAVATKSLEMGEANCRAGWKKGRRAAMDKSMLGDLESLPEEDKIRMSAMIDQLQIRDRSFQLRFHHQIFASSSSIGFSINFTSNCFSHIHSINLVSDSRVSHWSGSLRMYNTLVERCFSDCVDTFRRKSLDKQEETCVRRCAEKFLKHSMRVGMRFAELNQGAPTPD